MTAETTRELIGNEEVADRLLGLGESVLQPPAVDRGIARKRLREALFSETVEPIRLGRHVLLQRLGQGAMGVVYAAFDPHLGRRVAIKIVRAGGTPGASRRLLREAQSLARVSDPNVVAVHDVGFLDADGHEVVPTTDEAGAPPASDPPLVYVAMEYIEGVTLREWIASKPRSLPEILSMFVQAARGLAAAHEAGLVHRDFKPENVMIGDDRGGASGRVRVLDFGLAHASEAPSTSSSQSGEVAVSISGSQIGDSHVIAGTPAYMAPEQFEGGIVDPRADQFSFCVALWEVLYGARPFAGTDVSSLARAVCEGEIVKPPPGRAPAWVLRVLLRGLATDPAARHRDMRALVAALTDDPSRRRRRRVGVAVAAATAVALAAVPLLSRARANQQCERAAQQLRESWNDEVRAGVQDGLLATGVPFASGQLERVELELDRYVQDWSAGRLDACLAARVEGTRTEAIARRADDCFDEARDATTAWIEALRSAQPDTVARAVESTTKLPRLATCNDEVALARRPDPPTDASTRDRIASARRELLRVQALGWSGQLREAAAAIETLRAGIDDVGSLPLAADVYASAATQLGRLGEDARARELFEQALDRSVAAVDDDRTARTMIDLVQLEAGRLHQSDRAETWARAVEPLLARLEPEPGLATAQLEQALGTLADGRHDYAAALTRFRASLAIRERILPPEHLELAPAYNSIAVMAWKLGEYDLTAESLEHALRIRRRVLGEDHPDVLMTESNLANIEIQRGQIAPAIRRLERLAVASDRVYGPSSPEPIRILRALAMARLELRDYAEAIAAIERALALAEGRGDATEVVSVLMLLGRAWIQRGDPETARAKLRRAHQIYEADHLDDPSLMVGIAVDSSWASTELADFGEARRWAHQAIALIGTAGESPTDLARAHADLCEIERATGQLDQAQSSCQRALQLALAADPVSVTNATYYRLLGAVDVERGELAAARVLFETARALVAQTPGSSVNAAIGPELDLAMLAHVEHDDRDALARYQSLVERAHAELDGSDPDRSEAELGLAEALLAMGRSDEAQARASEVLATRKLEGYPSNQIAEAELVLGRATIDAGEVARGRALVDHACADPRAAVIPRLRRCPH